MFKNLYFQAQSYYLSMMLKHYLIRNTSICSTSSSTCTLYSTFKQSLWTAGNSRIKRFNAWSCCFLSGIPRWKK